MGTRDTDLYARVERQLPRLAGEMVARFRTEIPLYAELPAEQLEGEIAAITADNLRIFFRTLREGRAPTDAELAEPRTSAARRAEERVPLDAVLTAYHIGGRLGWQALVDAARPEETSALVDAGARVLDYMQHVTAAVATAYLEERQSIYGEERDARRALAQALLAGEPTGAHVARLGVRLPPAWQVLVLELPAVGQAGSEVARAVASRRLLRRVVAALGEQAGELVVDLLDPGGGPVLLPVDTEPRAPAEESPDARVGAAVEAVAAVVGGPVRAGLAGPTGTAGLPPAAAEAREVLSLAVRLEHPPRVYRLTDLLVDYQLSRPSPALPLLAGRLEPLASHPDLIATLECYLAGDLDRRRTAASLHVHPNTLDYRLRRIVELTGLDPGTPRGLASLGAALVARQTMAG